MQLHKNIFYLTAAGVLTSINHTSAQIKPFYQCMPITCEAGEYKDGNDCKKCPAGTYNPTPGATSVSACKTCSAGKYSGKGASQCITCTEGQYFDEGTESCTDCPAGSYCTGGKQITCPSGFYCKNGTKTACPIGKTSASGARTSAQCSECGAVQMYFYKEPLYDGTQTDRSTYVCMYPNRIVDVKKDSYTYMNYIKDRPSVISSPTDTVVYICAEGIQALYNCKNIPEIVTSSPMQGGLSSGGSSYISGGSSPKITVDNYKDYCTRLNYSFSLQSCSNNKYR